MSERKLSSKAQAQIFKDLMAGVSIDELAQQYRVDKRQIRSIRSNAESLTRVYAPRGWAQETEPSLKGKSWMRLIWTRALSLSPSKMKRLKQAWTRHRLGVLGVGSALVAFVLWAVPLSLAGVGLQLSTVACVGGYEQVGSLSLVLVRIYFGCGPSEFAWASYGWFQTDRIPAALCFLAIAAYLFWQRSVARNTNIRSRRSGMTLLLPDSLTREQVTAALGVLVLVAFISHSVGHSAGYDIGYDYGYSAGEEAGYEKGYGEGYSKGEDDGAKQGYSGGYEDGYSEGSSDGYNEGLTDGCEWVFEQSGNYSYVTAYNPFNSYNRYPGWNYVSESNC